MGALYGKMVVAKQRELSDIPLLWRAKTEAWLKENGHDEYLSKKKK